MNTKKPIYTIAVPSTDFTREAFLDCSGIAPTIRFEYELNGNVHHDWISFDKVSAMRMRSERCCTAWQIDGAYDTLIEIVDSTWISEIRSEMPKQYQNSWFANHYLICLDSVGCFEFDAEDWKSASLCKAE